MTHRFPLLGAWVLISLAVSTAAFAADNPERTQIGHNINVGKNGFFKSRIHWYSRNRFGANAGNRVIEVAETIVAYLPR